MPISNCSSLPASSLLTSEPRLLVSAVGEGRGAAGVRARPLTFLRFIVRGANGSDMMGEVEMQTGGEEAADWRRDDGALDAERKSIRGDSGSIVRQ